MQRKFEFGFEIALIGREDKYPFLARCVAGMELVNNLTIEWQVGPQAPDQEYGQTWENWVEIVQTPFVAGASMDEALDEHLAAVEDIILNGVGHQASRPNVRPFHGRACKGARTLLGRDPRLSDEVRLRPLRDLLLHLNVSLAYGTPVKHRWLSEISVQVIPRTLDLSKEATEALTAV